MIFSHTGRTIVTAALCIFASVSAKASILNVPAAKAQVAQVSPSNCYVDFLEIGAVTSLPEFCQLLFPIDLPAGTVIKQISIVHGTYSVGLPSPSISAELRTMSNGSWSDQTESFAWTSAVPVANDANVVSPIMAQSGKLYPDAFTMETNKMYVVQVSLTDGSYATGLQIIYN